MSVGWWTLGAVGVFVLWYIGSAVTVGYIHLLDGRETSLARWLSRLFPGSARAARRARREGDSARLRAADARVRDSLRRLFAATRWVLWLALGALLVVFVAWLLGGGAGG